MIAFDVLGEPKAQPRAKARRCGGFVMIYTPATAKQWKGLVADAAKPFLLSDPIEGPVALTLRFRFARPKSHLTSKGELTKSAPQQKTSKPDLDNLEKAIMDAITDVGLWRDDSQVTVKTSSKEYGTPEGVSVEITQL